MMRTIFGRMMWIVVALLGWAMTGSAETELTGMMTVPGSAVAKVGLPYRSLTMEEGLRSNTVRSLLQDRDGFIFMGTDNGLCRYDSHEITYYYNPLRGSDPFVSTLHAFGNGLLVGTSRGLCHFDTRTEQFSSFLPRINTTVNQVVDDRDGNLWICTQRQGVFRYNKRTHDLRQYPFPQNGGDIRALCVGIDNQVWAYTTKGRHLLYRLNKASQRFEPVGTKGASADGGGMSMLQDGDGTLWLGSWSHGLFRMDADGTLKQVINPTLTGAGLHIHSLLYNNPHTLFIGCDDGLLRYDIATNRWSRYPESAQSHDVSNDDRFVYAVIRDREGGLWYGTFYGGVKYVSPVSHRFVSFSAAEGQRGNVVGHFCEDGMGHVWIGSDDGGLSCYSLSHHAMMSFPAQQRLSTLNVHALWAEGNALWIGTYSDGILRMDITSGSVTTVGNEGEYAVRSCYALMRDSRHRLWAGTMEDVRVYDEKVRQFRSVCHTGVLVLDIDEDRNGNLWFSTQGAGLYRLDARTGRFHHYMPSRAEGSLPSSQVNSIDSDERGQLWIATSNGLCCYDARSDRFRRVNIAAPSQEVNSVVCDGYTLWLGTTMGLVRYIPGEPTRIFNRYDGLASNHFQSNAALKASDGSLFFGTVKGFSTFLPYTILLNRMVPQVFITALAVLNQPQRVGSKLLPEALGDIRQLDLGYKDNMFTLTFSALSYCAPEKNRFAYRLDGFDKDWIDAGNRHTATYTNLPAGTYTFRVKATNNDGIWSREEARLVIVVHPPFWWSLPAKLFYLAVLLLLIYYYTQLRLRRAERRHQREMQRLSEQKAAEVREARLRFFTMIAHEIRTPVTLIIGPLEKLMQKKEARASDDLNIIDRNAHRLLELVNQLLDFNKVEHGFELHFERQSIAAIMHAVAERFLPSMEQRGITLDVAYPPQDFLAVVDAEGLTKIISNLMTNATKYTHDHVDLCCHVDATAGRYTISVADNGAGISAEDREKIFRPFFQAKDNKPGTGIGLSIVQNLVEAHDGEISVESEPGRGTRMIVKLPVTPVPSLSSLTEETTKAVKTEGEDEETKEGSAADEKMMAEAKDQKEQSAQQETVLIVEDDPDMSHYIAKNFQPHYQVLTAGNGCEALDVLSKHAVTLIVSDWMMPEMDGASLCRSVRNDARTSHIPFIMLTAKTDDASKTESMDCGADAFIEKPFSMQYLEACIRNMIAMRRRLMQRFAATPNEPVPELAKAPMDNALLRQMNEIIEENIDNPDFNVQMLAERLNISRSGLFAKVKAITDTTPNEMIQIVRLRKAARLLKTKQYRVSEVAYQVGFNNPSYFSKCFQKQFGVKPGEY
uniref:two-component regulator propeller domain-containing protein n=1 Tax=Prevotella sp. TaxID=59823 RepID=UPI00402774DE